MFRHNAAISLLRAARYARSAQSAASTTRAPPPRAATGTSPLPTTSTNLNTAPQAASEEARRPPPPPNPTPDASMTTHAESSKPTLHMTKRCAQRLQHLSRQRKSHVVLRVLVDGGGCSGLQYVYELENWDDMPTDATLQKEDDVLLQEDGVCLIVDSISLGFMSGAKVDYVEEMISSSFRVLENPNSEASCGCGVSFAPKSE